MSCVSPTPVLPLSRSSWVAVDAEADTAEFSDGRRLKVSQPLRRVPAASAAQNVGTMDVLMGGKIESDGCPDDERGTGVHNSSGGVAGVPSPGEEFGRRSHGII